MAEAVAEEAEAVDVLAETVSFELKGRIGLVVYVQSLKQVKALRRYANLYYVSRREKYAFLYTDLDGHETIIEKINALPFVDAVVRSERPFIAETYEPKQK